MMFASRVWALLPTILAWFRTGSWTKWLAIRYLCPQLGCCWAVSWPPSTGARLEDHHSAWKKATVEVEWLGASRIMGKSTPVDTLFHPEKSKEDKKTGPKKKACVKDVIGHPKKNRLPWRISLDSAKLLSLLSCLESVKKGRPGCHVRELAFTSGKSRICEFANFKNSTFFVKFWYFAILRNSYFFKDFA